jgi:predicted PurR-regulated permease PerM
MAVEDTPLQSSTVQSAALAPKVKEPSASRWVQNLVGIGVILGLCNYAEEVLAIMLISVLLAFILAPIADLLTRMRLPRALAAGIALLLLLAVIMGTVYYSYNQAVILVQDLPKYARQAREEMMRFRKRAETFEVLNLEPEKGVVNVRPATDWTDLFTRGFGSVTQAIIAASFVPFLVFFMLTWQNHVRSATVMLFPLENRHTAYVTLGLISKMIRTFMVGNFLIGLFIGALSTIIFWSLHLPFFYFVGFVSGFLSLVPYLGALLALVPPIFVSLGHMGAENYLYIFLSVLGLHVIAINVLYPKFLGNRLQLNPLAVTMSALVWGWLWGGLGLVLAVPITAAMKIIFDHVGKLKPYGAWLGE